MEKERTDRVETGIGECARGVLFEKATAAQLDRRPWSLILILALKPDMR